jgi:hypothetical protein
MPDISPRLEGPVKGKSGKPPWGLPNLPNTQTSGNLLIGLGDLKRVVGVSPLGPPFFFVRHRMYLLYLDASGTPDLKDTAQPTFILLGLTIHEGNWFALEKRVAGLKRQYEFPGVPLELHAKDICSSIKEQAEISAFETLSREARRAEVLSLREKKLAGKAPKERQVGRERYRATEATVHLTRLERSRLYEAALELVGSHEEIRLFAEIVDKAHLLKTTGKRHAVGHAFEQVLSRFDSLLKNFARSGSGQVNNGVAVVDVDPNSDLIRDLTTAFRTNGHHWGALEHVIETPFFVDSKIVSGIQLADICAYAVRRYIEKPDRAGSHEEKQFLRIFHKFDRAGERLHGIRHYCPAGECTCMICAERRH